MTNRRILKWLIPIDDRFHPIGSGAVAHVDVQNGIRNVVVVWTDEPDADNVVIRSARVYGTGQPLPVADEHLGSVVDDPLVWHVLASSEERGVLGLVDDGEDDS